MDSFFKTQVQNDLNRVFFNNGEFGETHNINGVDVICTIEDDETQGIHPSLSRFDGAFKETIILFISESNINFKPAYNQIITVDKNRYRINLANLYNGMYEFTLEAIK